MQYYINEVKNKTIDDESFKKMIGIFVDAFLYEPANFRLSLSTDICQDNNYYVRNKAPTSLHKYIQEFTRKNKEIKTNCKRSNMKPTNHILPFEHSQMNTSRIIPSIRINSITKMTDGSLF